MPLRTDRRGPEYDAVVIGGGPAGASAGALLASWGYKVALLDRPPARRRLAETLPPSARKLLAAVGAAEDVETAGFYRTSGNTAWWGREPKRVERYGPRNTRMSADSHGRGAYGYQVRRDDFDRLLLRHAALAGVQIERGVVRRCEAACVEYTETATGETRRATGRFVLDCSGRAGVIARNGFRVDEPGFATMAVTGTWVRDAGWSDCLDDPTHTIVETFDEGWAWSIPTSTSRRDFTVMVDRRGLTGLRRGHLAIAYRRWLARARHCAGLLRGAMLDGRVFVSAASLYSARTYADGPYLLVGDAGSFIDPLSSFGVKKALASAWRAAVVVNTAITHPDRASEALGFFTNRERDVYRSYLRQAGGYFHAAADAHPHAFWRDRAHAALHQNDAMPRLIERALALDGDVRRAFERLKASDRLTLRRAPDVSIERRPEIVGREVALVDWIVSPRIPDGLRHVGAVELPPLFRLAGDHDQVGDLFEAYCRRRPPAPLSDFLAALALLVGKGLLE